MEDLTKWEKAEQEFAAEIKAVLNSGRDTRLTVFAQRSIKNAKEEEIFDQRITHRYL